MAQAIPTPGLLKMWISIIQKFQLLQEHLCSLSFSDAFYNLFWLFIKDGICNRLFQGPDAQGGAEMQPVIFLQLQTSEMTQETTGICCWGKLSSTHQQEQEFQWYPHTEFVPCLNNSQLTCDRCSACFCSLRSKCFLGGGVTGTERALVSGHITSSLEQELSPADEFSSASFCGILLKVILALWLEMGSFREGRFGTVVLSYTLFPKSRLLEKNTSVHPEIPCYSCSQPDLNCWNTSF